jgi:hypothetical protein
MISPTMGIWWLQWASGGFEAGHYRRDFKEVIKVVFQVKGYGHGVHAELSNI